MHFVFILYYGTYIKIKHFGTNKKVKLAQEIPSQYILRVAYTPKRLEKAKTGI